MRRKRQVFRGARQGLEEKQVPVEQLEFGMYVAELANDGNGLSGRSRLTGTFSNLPARR
jgi:hypothetical protein